MEEAGPLAEGIIGCCCCCCCCVIDDDLPADDDHDAVELCFLALDGSPPPPEPVLKVEAAVRLTDAAAVVDVAVDAPAKLGGRR